ncbi:MAG: response regulator [Candidatus Thorarchaeota archaeon]
MTRILLVDDDAELLDVAKILLHQSDPDLEVVVSRSVRDALKLVESESFDVVITDYLMPDATGLDLLEALRSSGDNIGAVIWTGHSTEEVAIRALNLGADRYILKGSDVKEQFSEIRDVIRDIVRRKQEARQASIEFEAASEFIHRLSHDITGMVHNIMGFATLLEEEHSQRYIDGISKQTRRIRERMQKAVADIDEGLIR